MVSMRRKVSLAVLLSLILVLGAAFFRVVAPFLLPLFLAGMTAVVCQPLFRYFLMRTKDRIAIASALTTATILAAILIPIITGVLMATLQLYTFGARISFDSRWSLPRSAPVGSVTPQQEPDSATATAISNVDDESITDVQPEMKEVNAEEADNDLRAVADQQSENIEKAADASAVSAIPVESRHTQSFFEDAVTYVNQWLPAELQRSPIQVAEEIRHRLSAFMHNVGDRSLGRAAGTTFGILAGTAGTIVAGLIGVMMYVVALYYFLADGTTLLMAAEKLIPVHAKYQRQLLEQFAMVVRSVVVATFLAALAQGIATTLALWFFGFDHLFVLLILATVTALIPIAGTWIVWVPCCVILFAGGHWFQASLLAIYGAAFVGFLDNVVRTYILNSDTKLHPLLAFISILGGIQVMGLWGVFIGPIIASCLHALVKIFNHELQELTQDRENADVAGVPKPA